MVKICELQTPGFLVDLDKLERNIQDMADLCRNSGKQLWPMMKTHKSTRIARMQRACGAMGFLAGTIDEAEKLAEDGIREIMLAYPVASESNIERVLGIARSAHVILSFDGIEAAVQIQNMLASADMHMDYLIIVDCGFHRFGVVPERVVDLAERLKEFSRLKLRGIATHPGHVYGKEGVDQIKAIAAEEVGSLTLARDLLVGHGHPVEMVATGCTPTTSLVVGDDNINVFRPGNYVFYDAIQVAMGVVPAERCALTVLATIIAHPREDLFMMDAGSKCFGLDKGAHGVNLTSGYGMVKGRPELIVEGLSEEVGKLRVQGESTLRIGEKIEVIPNHACSAANMTDYLIGRRKGIALEIIHVDARSGLYRQGRLSRVSFPVMAGEEPCL